MDAVSVMLWTGAGSAVFAGCIFVGFVSLRFVDRARVVLFKVWADGVNAWKLKRQAEIEILQLETETACSNQRSIYQIRYGRLVLQDQRRQLLNGWSTEADQDR